LCWLCFVKCNNDRLFHSDKLLFSQPCPKQPAEATYETQLSANAAIDRLLFEALPSSWVAIRELCSDCSRFSTGISVPVERSGPREGGTSSRVTRVRNQTWPRSCFTCILFLLQTHFLSGGRRPSAVKEKSEASHLMGPSNGHVFLLKPAPSASTFLRCQQKSV
jgi:hypothetical protein